MEEFEYDVVIYGTGLVNCLVASILTKNKLKVLQIDKYSEYGNNYRTLTFKQLLELKNLVNLGHSSAENANGSARTDNTDSSRSKLSEAAAGDSTADSGDNEVNSAGPDSAAVNRAISDDSSFSSIHLSTQNSLNSAPSSLQSHNSLDTHCSPLQAHESLNSQTPLDSPKQSLSSLTSINSQMPQPVPEQPELNGSGPVRANSSELVDSSLLNHVEQPIYYKVDPFGKNQEQVLSELLKQSNSFNIDLWPRIMLNNTLFTEFLVYTNIHKQLQLCTNINTNVLFTYEALLVASSTNSAAAEPTSDASTPTSKSATKGAVKRSGSKDKGNGGSKDANDNDSNDQNDQNHNEEVGDDLSTSSTNDGDGTDAEKEPTASAPNANNKANHAPPELLFELVYDKNSIFRCKYLDLREKRLLTRFIDTTLGVASPSEPTGASTDGAADEQQVEGDSESEVEEEAEENSENASDDEEEPKTDAISGSNPPDEKSAESKADKKAEKKAKKAEKKAEKQALKMEKRAKKREKKLNKAKNANPTDEDHVTDSTHSSDEPDEDWLEYLKSNSLNHKLIDLVNCMRLSLSHASSRRKCSRELANYLGSFKVGSDKLATENRNCLIYCLYGTNNLIQHLCRLCSLHNCHYMLNNAINSMEVVDRAPSPASTATDKETTHATSTSDEATSKGGSESGKRSGKKHDSANETSSEDGPDAGALCNNQKILLRLNDYSIYTDFVVTEYPMATPAKITRVPTSKPAAAAEATADTNSVDSGEADDKKLLVVCVISDKMVLDDLNICVVVPGDFPSDGNTDPDRYIPLNGGSLDPESKWTFVLQTCKHSQSSPEGLYVVYFMTLAHRPSRNASAPPGELDPEVLRAVEIYKSLVGDLKHILFLSYTYFSTNYNVEVVTHLSTGSHNSSHSTEKTNTNPSSDEPKDDASDPADADANSPKELKVYNSKYKNDSLVLFMSELKASQRIAQLVLALNGTQPEAQGEASDLTTILSNLAKLDASHWSSANAPKAEIDFDQYLKSMMPDEDDQVDLNCDFIMDFINKFI